MAKVLPFHGLTKLYIPVDRLLEGAKGKLDSVVILGYDKDEEEYFASSMADGGDVLWLLEKCKIVLMGMEE